MSSKVYKFSTTSAIATTCNEPLVRANCGTAAMRAGLIQVGEFLNGLT